MLPLIEILPFRLPRNTRSAINYPEVLEPIMDIFMYYQKEVVLSLT